ncbi:LAMP1 [Branchiostoma lanceolatum]|uniref:LAMP1 protein n=1 Tax=Branchiostoma lanceolatum TaxID=7740 RepID=A0A8J9Z398_BRALA|nr:LAMP1 [Branchiostoma lanceolatum]
MVKVFHNVVVLLALTVGVQVSSYGSVPPPPGGSFVLKDVYNDECLLLDISAMFYVGYTKTDNTTATASFALPADSSASGHCSHVDNDYNAHIDLRFNADDAIESDATFGLDFAFVRTRDTFWLASASIYYTLQPDMFPEAKNANEKVSSVLSGLQDFLTSSSFYFPHSYTCDREQVLTFTDPDRPVSTLAIHTIQLQPFHVPTSGNFSEATACSDSITTPSPRKTTKPYPVTTPDNITTIPPTEIPIGNGTTIPPTEIPLANGTTIPPTAIPIGNVTTIPPTEIPIGNGTTIPPTEIPIVNGTTIPPTEIPIGNGTTIPPTEIPIGNGTTIPPTEIPIVNGTTIPPTEIPIGNGTTISPTEIPIGNGTTIPPTEIPIGNGTTIPPTEIPIGNGTTIPPTEIPIGNGTTIPPTEIPIGNGTTIPPTEIPIGNGTTIPPTEIPIGNGTTIPPTEIPIGNGTTIPPTEIPIANGTTVPPTEIPIGNCTTIPPTSTTATSLPIGNVTTDQPLSTTTVPVKNSTTIMTTPKPLTPPPEPPQGHYEVKDRKGHVCLLADMGLQFKIIYTKTDSETGTSIFNLPITANDAGFCNSDHSNMTLRFFDDIFSVTFDFVKANNQFRVSSLDILYTELPSIFPETKSPNARRHVSNNTMNIFSADGDKSYKCNADVNITVTKDVSILARQVQLQPFGVKSGQFSSAQECPEDANKGNNIAIVIGVLIGVGVVVVLISYIIVRKRTVNSTNYANLT